MDNEPIQINVSSRELKQLAQLAQNILNALPGAPVNYRPIGPFVTIDAHCKQRWPLATKKNQRRIRDVCLGMYRERVGREPYKLNGQINAPFLIEEENVRLLDRAIDVVRNEVEAREKMPLFNRRAR